jgi:hypothetical protein
MKKIFFVILLLGINAFAQQKFEIRNASKNFNVRVEVEKCAGGFCEGAATFRLLKKGGKKPFQVFKLADTSLWLDKNGKAQANTTILYDEQSAVNFGDFNFDGAEDLALCDGTNGGYGMPSYQVYLFSPQSKKFVRSAPLTNLAQGVNLGMFEVDAKRKVLRTFSKDGCCWHQTQEFQVVGNRPKKILEITEDATIPDETKVEVTTKKLAGGRWRTSVKKVKREE